MNEKNEEKALKVVRVIGDKVEPIGVGLSNLMTKMSNKASEIKLVELMKANGNNSEPTGSTLSKLAEMKMTNEQMDSIKTILAVNEGNDRSAPSLYVKMNSELGRVIDSLNAQKSLMGELPLSELNAVKVNWALKNANETLIESQKEISRLMQLAKENDELHKFAEYSVTKSEDPIK